MSPPSLRAATATSRRCEACRDHSPEKTRPASVHLAWAERRRIRQGGTQHLVAAAANNEVPRYHYCSATTRVCAPSKIFEALSGEATFKLSRVLESLSRPYQRNKKACWRARIYGTEVRFSGTENRVATLSKILCFCLPRLPKSRQRRQKCQARKSSKF
jgi:hypothetical protein